MTDKQIMIDACPYQGECSISGCRRNDDDCFVRQLFEERDRAENQIVELNKTIKAEEQECEELEGRLKYIINENKVLKDCATDEHIDIVALKNYISTLEYHNDQLKAEVKSKTEYIQEQREIIDEYSKEIRMYKKCQGNRASKREEELKQALTEIEGIAKNMNTSCFYDDFDCTDCDMKNGCIFLGRLKILQKIKACEVHND